MCLSSDNSRLCPVSRGASAPADVDIPQRDAGPSCHDDCGDFSLLVTILLTLTFSFASFLIVALDSSCTDPGPTPWYGLVGVELNPGPPKKGGAKKTVVQKSQKPIIVMQAAKAATKSKETLGHKIGGWVGDLAQKAIMGITGMGDYTVKSNSLVNSPNGPPGFSSGASHSIVVAHREFVTLVSSPGSNFNVNTYYINPTSALFPWLGALAANFEIFCFKGLVVEFKATSATAVSSTNTALGSVMIATQYNALAPPFVDQQQMEAYEFCTSSVAFTSMIHPVECDPREAVASELYTDLGYISGDPRFSILGVVNVATVGQQAASVLGELWVSYEVSLIRPRLFGSFPTQGYTFRIGTTTAAASNTDLFSALAAQQIAGTSALPSSSPSSMTLDVILGSSSMNTGGGISNTIQFPRGIVGYFMITYYSSGSAVTINAPTTVTASNGLAPFLVLLGATAITASPVTGTASCPVFTYRICVSVGLSSGANTGLPTLTFPTGTVLPGSTGSSIDIIQFNS